jgi:hypothetical protein
MYVLFSVSNILLIMMLLLCTVPTTGLFGLKPATAAATTPAGELSMWSVDDLSDRNYIASTPPVSLFGAKNTSSTTAAPAGEITL